MRRGAFDYLPKPFTPSQIRALLERVARIGGVHSRFADLEQRVRADVPEAVLDSRDSQVRSIVWVFMPISVVVAMMLMATGVPMRSGSGPCRRPPGRP